MALTSVALNAATGAPQTTQWGDQNHNADKVDFNDPSVPMWVKMGFPDNAAGISAYNNIYGSQPAATPPLTSGPTPLTPTDPQDAYLAINTSAGDAWKTAEDMLARYGLQGLDSVVKTGIVNGWSQSQTYETIRNTPEYQQRFAAIIQREKQGLPPLSEDDVVNLEHSYAGVFQAAGLPPGLYDNPSDYVNYIVRDVSVAEMQDRVQKGIQAAQSAPADVRSALQGYYGVTDGELVSYFLDPTKTEDLLMRQFTSAQLGGAASRTGFGSLTRDNAEYLNSINPGMGADAAAQGFGTLASEHELMQSLPGQAGNNITQQQQIAAQFGNDATQQQRIKDAAAARVAQFKSGGGYTQTKEGFTGLSNAR